MAIVLNPGKQQDEFRGEMFCWNELPELLLVDDLFDLQKDYLLNFKSIHSHFKSLYLFSTSVGYLGGLLGVVNDGVEHTAFTI